MATEGEPSFSAAAPRGAGGKLRRQPARKAVTPYSRPPQNQPQRSRWISRIVDPAYRIIAGGATRILPYFFSKENTASALPSPDAPEQEQEQGQAQDHQDKSQNVLKEHADGDNLTPLSNNLVPRSTDVGGPMLKEKGKQNYFDISAKAKGKMTSNDDGGISELERLMEGRKFSRDEVDRLLEIINSRAVDLPDVGKEKKNAEMPSDEEAKNFAISLQKKEPISGKETNNDLWTVSTPLPKSIVKDEVGLSPVELAKAYMGGQTPALASKGLVSANESDNLDGDMFSAKPSMASPSSKPSTCWPGAKSTEQYGFGTPQSQRERFGLHNLPRTPYSRTILSKSKSKVMQLQDDSSKRLNIFQSPSQRVQTPYWQSKGTDADRGSFGPSRRFRPNATTASRMSPYSRPPSVTPQLENSEGFFPAIKKNPESGGPSSSSRSQAAYATDKRSDVGTPTVPPHSSQIARTILEHLERNQPTPKDKSTELKLATSWRKPQSLDAVEQRSSNSNNADKDSSAALNSDKGIFFSNNLPSSLPRPRSATTTSKDENATNKTAPALNGTFGGTQATNNSGSALLFGFGEPKDSHAKSKHEEDAAKTALPLSSGAETFNLPKPASHSPGSKPVLPAISIAKPVQRWAFSPDPSSGFTFPISSSSSGASSEPPTPSIMPSTNSPPAAATASITEHLQKDKAADEEAPQFSFGKNRSKSRSLNFSAPFTGDDGSPSAGGGEDEDPKFTFGGENAQRISFSSFGNDAPLCC